MRRRLFAVVSAVSLLLCAGAVAMWLWTYNRHANPSASWARRGGRFYLLAMDHNTVQLATATPWPCDESSESLSDHLGPDVSPTGDMKLFTHAGVVVSSFPTEVEVGMDHHVIKPSALPAPSLAARTVPVTWSQVWVPTWMLVCLTSILPATWTIRRGICGLRRVTRRDACPACDYNLTGNTSGTCPECGTPVPKEPAEKSPRSA